jgi:hypothetical protein
MFFSLRFQDLIDTNAVKFHFGSGLPILPNRGPVSHACPVGMHNYIQEVIILQPFDMGTGKLKSF